MGSALTSPPISSCSPPSLLVAQCSRPAAFSSRAAAFRSLQQRLRRGASPQAPLAVALFSPKPLCRCQATSAQQDTSSLSTEDLKAQLVRSVANTNRGKATTAGQRASILELVLALEGRNPTPRPAESELLDGRWSLLYQVPLREQDAEGRNPDTTLEGPLLARLRPLAGGALRSRGITQIIDRTAGSVSNIADFSMLGASGSLNIRGTCAQTGDSDADPGAARVDVAFVDFVLQLGPLRVVVPLSWAKPQGWVLTTYVDGDLRIGRGDKGSVFVTARQRK